MKTSIFACSTGYTSMLNGNEVGGMSYIDMMTTPVDGVWINGLTILHVRKLLPLFLRNRNVKHIIIIHVGVVETITVPPENFLFEGIRYLHYYGMDSYFGAFVMPRMLKAGKALTHKRNEFYSFLEPYQVRELFDDVAIMLEGFNVIMMGMSCPFGNSRWIQQASITNDIIRDVCLKYNSNFVDVWNMCNDNVVDSNHLTEEGHRKIWKRLENLMSLQNA